MNRKSESSCLLDAFVAVRRRSLCPVHKGVYTLSLRVLICHGGAVDKMLGGYGLSRGRRNPGELRVGDALDFWKVADLKKNKRVLLVAQMKLPGKAWLEFAIEGDQLIQTAHYYPNGLWGRLYWYVTGPFHNLVFQNLAEKIVKHAGQIA